MRISHLKLLKYGLFEDSRLDLPQNAADIHLVYGDNEDGKSTILAALEDLLFGFPKSTPYDFQFPMKDLRLGVKLASGDDSFEFLRRKGNKDTIVDEDGQAIAGGEKALAGFLQGVDQAFFQRMFFLNHRRLREGADDLLAVGEDAGETLLASGAGVQGLSGILQRYDERATSLWTKNYSKNRAFYQANDKLKTAVADERAAVVNAAQYKSTKRAYEESRTSYNDHRTNMQELQAQLTKLGRIRRVHRDVRALVEAELAREELEGVVLLPADAASILDEEDRTLRHLASKRSIFEDRIKEHLSSIDDLDVDDTLLQRASEIRDLNESRLKVQNEREALPRRKDELDVLDAQVAALAKNLGWKTSAKQSVSDLIPSGPVVANARSLATEYATLSATLDAARTTIDGVGQRVKRLKSRQSTANTVDVSLLLAAYDVARDGSAVVGSRESEEGALDRAEAAIKTLRAGLTPSVDDDDSLRTMPAPSLVAIDTHRETHVTLLNKRRDLRDDLVRARNELAEIEGDIKQKGQIDGVLSETNILDLRGARDKAWELIRRRHIDGDKVSESEWRDVFADDASGTNSFPTLVSAADRGADDRFTHAEAAANLSSLAGRARKTRLTIKSGEATLTENTVQQSALDDEWADMWAESGLMPGSPDAMATWSTKRDECLSRMDERDDALLKIDRYRAKENEMKTELIKQVLALDLNVDTLDNKSLEQTLATAKQVIIKTEAANTKIEDQAADIKDAEDDKADAATDLEKINEQLIEWGSRWDEALGQLGLAKKMRADEVEAYLTLIEKTAQTVEKSDDLRQNRIAKIERDIERYESRVSEMATSVATDLKEDNADEIVLALDARLTRSKEHLVRRQAAEKDIESARTELEGLADDEQGARDAIADLHRRASTKSIDKLRVAIQRSDNLRNLTDTIDGLLETLGQDGDQRSIDDLKVEVDGVDLDKAEAEESRVREELAALEDPSNLLRDTMNEKKAEFDAIGTSSNAAEAASRRQYALAEIEGVAESFVRARAAEKLLRWGIDYFRRQKQGPMLEKASSLFSIITGGRYQKLIIAYDDDVPVLAGLDSDGAKKGAGAMSEGTRDQLYLALRLAAVEDYVERATPMPFVADDIFINFDDSRTASALNALYELSKRCQVIIFTHHAHLIEIAKQTLPDTPSIITLA